MEGGKANRGNMKSCCRIKDENGRLALEEVEVRRFLRKEQVGVHMRGFN